MISVRQRKRAVFAAAITVVGDIAEVEAGFSVSGARPGYDLAQERRLPRLAWGGHGHGSCRHAHHYHGRSVEMARVICDLPRMAMAMALAMAMATVMMCVECRMSKCGRARRRDVTGIPVTLALT